MIQYHLEKEKKKDEETERLTDKLLNYVSKFIYRFSISNEEIVYVRGAMSKIL
jgi:hypothetical protein